ncbi:TonB-dependent receptor [Sphingomonas gellani]|uniref:TonB-dependent receptor n=1 Tax=Sphingomonas gellani TaxID=1166340 RepID=A0A1H8IL57_9SPHN|nr:TonB-dependent receptor [Sphingomonas gellani]SEN69161.1 TonB-dependent receptor [Sphingomonas gellani]
MTETSVHARAVLRHRLLAATLITSTVWLPGMATAQTAPQAPPPPAGPATSSSDTSTTATGQAPQEQGAGQTQPTQVDGADAAAADPSASGNQDIVVTGLRASLQSQANAKKNSVGFTDSIFAEDIGKSPDTNIAEALNRIPGVTINRDITGEGLQVSIRGLGTNFTRVLLNGAPVAIASSGGTDAQNTNREVDLDLLPTELFTQLTVSKSPTAAQIEGGAAGTVNLRSARPFDRTGKYLSYGAQATKGSNANDWGYRGYALASATFGDTLGILVGAAGVRNPFAVNGYETIGLTNPNLTAAQRTGGTRNPTGGGNWTIPGTVPVNAGNGLTPGAVIDQAFLLRNNPGATIDQIDNGLLPRLGRPAYEEGHRDRYNFIASAEWRPSDALHFYVDGLYGRKKNNFDRVDLDWIVRNSGIIPLNTTYDRSDCSAGCVVNSGTYANSQFFLEYRPYKEDTEFYGVNPGLDFVVNDWIKGDIQANYTKSNFRRENPTVLVNTAVNSGLTVTYDNNGGGIPNITSSVDLNNPANYVWAGGRLNLNGEERKTETKGIRGSLLFGKSDFNARVGAAYDDTQRRISPFDNTLPWQNAVCGNGPSASLPSPNTAPPCTGLNQPGATPPAGFPTYPAYGTGYTAGQPPLTYAGSLIPQSQLAGFLVPGRGGFITVDWSKFRDASQYDQYLAGATETGSASTGANGGLIREKVTGTFAELNGNIYLGDNTLRLNGGVRYVQTEQMIGARTSLTDPRNNTAAGVCPLPDRSLDGSCYPNVVNFSTSTTKYSNWLPSGSAAFEIGRHAVARASLSRTMTRPSPNSLVPGLSFSSQSADTAILGNQQLDPYISSNIDLGFEYYTGGEGLIGVAAFRKSITGFTVPQVTTVPFSSLAQYGVIYDTLTQAQKDAINSRGGPDGATVGVQQEVNSDGKLLVNGLEFQIVQPLDFLTQYIGVRGFGFQGNLTIIDQKGQGAGAPAIALGVSPTTYVATGYYEGNGISARLAYTWNEGSQTSSLNQYSIPSGAYFTDSYGQLDFAGNVDLSKIFDNDALPTLVVNVINVTKSKLHSYFQFENANFSEFNPGRQVLIGLRGRF